MRKQFLFLCLWAILGGIHAGFSQTGCPGCVVSVPDSLSADTIYLADAPNGRAGEYYEADISFRLPKTTTPVAANDPTVIPNLTINHITISSVSNIPPGLNWQANQLEFDVAQQTDGCVRFCGTPLQPGLYEVEVVVTAKVLVISQTTSFSFPILIEPAVSMTEGFTMQNSSGCGDVAVSFQNNVPSGGKAGFSYKWDFGNGRTSLNENPEDQIYRTPGSYFVNYQAIVDTAGYFLTGIKVNKVSCSDLLGNRPDIFLEVLNPQGTLLYKSDVTNDAQLPLTYNLNIPVKEGNYTIRVTDKDDGFLGNDDDPCGTVTFNKFSTGNLEGVDFQSAITIIHPVDTVRSVDTVRVYAQPTPPILLGYEGEKLCKGDFVTLVTNYDNHIQWYKDGESIIGNMESTLKTTESGNYYLVYTSSDGCRAFSDTAKLNFAAPPTAPIFLNKENYLVLLEPNRLPDNFTAQWSLNNNLIPNANGINYCSNASGSYVLKITDNETGCSSSYSRVVTFDPRFAGCTTAAEDHFKELVQDLTLFPNPTNGPLWLQFGLNEATDVTLVVRNAVGMEISREVHRNLLGNNRLEINLQSYSSGMYFVELQVQDARKNLKVIKQ